VPASPAPQQQSYQSNIRTMADDLSSLKSGKQPQGTTLPKPVMPSPAPAPRPTPAPVQPVRPTAPTMPSTIPTLPTAKAPANPNQFFVPETPKAQGNSRNLLFIGIGAAVIVFGVLYWFLFIRPTATDIVEVPIETFTPRPTATPRVAIASIFPSSAGTVTFTADADPFQTFTAGLKTIVVSSGRLGVLTVSDANTGQPLLPFGFFDRLLIPYPVELKPALGNDDGVILAYGQQESFNAKGQVVQNTTASTRFAFVTRVSDSAAATLRTWEPTMTDTLESLFGVNKVKNSGPFSDAFYQGTSIRFKNFAYPDSAIDYALIPYNGVTYLVMANSREAMFAVISALNPPGK